jgi:hypothetical protein
MDIEISHQGEQPTFYTENRQEIIDFTVCAKKQVSQIRGWRVSSEPSLLDHRHILFDLVRQQEEKVNYRNVQTTCCKELQVKLHFGHFGTVKDTETAAEFLHQVTCLFIRK